MTTLLVTDAEYPTPSELLALFLSDLRQHYARLGVTLNVSKHSEPWNRCKTLANRVSLAIANGKLNVQAMSPLHAQGQDLLDLAAMLGITPRPASGAIGYMVAALLAGAPASVTIPKDYVITGPFGIKYETTAAKTISASDLKVQVQAVDTGTVTNEDAGTVCTWDSAAVGWIDQKATVDTGGLTGGKNADDVETVRARLLRKLSSPAVGGNWAHVVELAEGASAAVEAAFVYPTARGPASYDVVIMGDSDGPVLNSSVANLVASAITAEMPGSANLNTTSIVEQELDIIIDADLPLPKFAGGAGGGWKDSAPWPSDAETGVNVFAEVTLVQRNNRQITVNSTSADAPQVGNRFGLWNPDTETVQEFTILAVSGPSGAYVQTLEEVPSWVVTGMFCSAAAEHLQQYADDFLAAMRSLGPGEKTEDPDILQYALRKPGADSTYPPDVTHRTLAAISSQHSEVIDLSYGGRFETGTKTDRSSPAAPATTAQATRRLALANMSFRAEA